MTYLLDSDVCISWLRSRPASIAERLRNCQPGSVSVSAITVAELTYGALRSLRRDENLASLMEFLGEMPVVSLDRSVAERFAGLRLELERRGEQIGLFDLWVAAACLQTGAILVTNNTREFRRVPGLATESWV